MGIEGREREGYREKSEDTDDVEEELREALHEESRFQELKKDIEEMLSELEEEEFHRRVRRMMRELRDEERIRREIREASDKSESSEKEVGEADKPRERPEAEDGHQESSDVKGEVNEGHAQESYHESGDGTVYVTQQESQLVQEEEESTEKPEVQDDIEKEKTASEVEETESQDSSTEAEEPAYEVEQQREIADEIPDGEGQEKESTSTTEESENSEQSESADGEQDATPEMDIRAETPEPSSEGRREVKEETGGSEREREEIEAIPTEVSEKKVAQEELDEGENSDEKELDEEELTRRIRDLLEELEEAIREEIRTKEDLDRAIEDHPEVRDDPYFESAYEIACEYLEFKQRVRERYTEEELEEMSHVEVARELGYTISDASFWLHDREAPSLLERLYRLMREERLQELVDMVDEGGIGEGDAEANHLREVSRERLEEIFEGMDHREWSTDTLDHLVHALQEGLSDTESSIVYADLKRLEDLSQDGLERIDDLVKKWREARADLSEDTHEADTRFELRMAFIDGRFYLWKRDMEIKDLTLPYGSLYYYFRDEPTFSKYLNRARRLIDPEGDWGVKEIDKHIEKLLRELAPKTDKGACISKKIRRIEGKHIELINTIMGVPLRDLEGLIEKMTKYSGSGGVENPRFPEGHKLKLALARLIAVVVSDCNMNWKGALSYYEPDIRRVRIVIQGLQEFGDIHPNPKHNEDENYYATFFPSALGIALQYLGLLPGDKVVQNSGLPSIVTDGSWEIIAAFIGDLIPQDGTVDMSSITWNHTVALNPGSKSLKYGIPPKVSQREIDLIKEHGNPEKHCWALALGTLEDLTRSSEPITADSARTLQKIIMENPNRMITSGRRMLKAIGIEIDIKPYTTRFHKRTGRVSVAWYAVPKDIYETVKLGILAPLNDLRKRNIVKKMLTKHPEDVFDAIQELEGRGIRVQQWWMEE